LIGQKIHDLGELDAKTLADLWDTLAFGQPWRGEFCTRKKTGEPFWVHASVSPIAEDGRITHFLAVTLDVTDRKRAEEALRESEERFRKLAETTTAATFIFEGAHIRYANSAASLITGYSAAELASKNFWEIPPGHRGCDEAEPQRSLPGEHIPSRSELGIVTRGPHPLARLQHGLRRLGGKVLCLGTGLDITERRQAEQELRESEEKFHTLVDTMPAAVFIFQGTSCATQTARATKSWAIRRKTSPP
jgi:PAS domain S-box-containing protein